MYGIGGTPPGIVVEHLDDDFSPCGYHYRVGGWIPEQGAKKTWWAPGSRRTLFGFHLWGGTTTDVVLCEGETDTMALAQALPDKLCLGLGGNPSPELWVEWLADLRSMCGETGTLHLAFDSDAAGDAYTQYVDDHYTGKRCQLDLKSYKDAAELLLDGVGLDWLPLPRLPDDIQSASDLNAELRAGGDAFVPGKPLGLGHRIDELCSGHYPGSLLLVAAAAKAGKSSLCDQLVVNAIRDQHMRVLYLPLEMSKNEVQPRIGACLLAQELSKADSKDVYDAVDTIASDLYWVAHYGRITPADIDRWFKAIKLLGVSLFVIDPIQAATSSDGESDRAVAHLDAIMYYLKGKLNEYGISGIVASHTNNADYTEPVTPNNLRGSRGLAQIPTCALGIQRLDDGVCNISIVVVDRRYGKQGQASFEYANHNFKPIRNKGDKVL